MAQDTFPIDPEQFKEANKDYLGRIEREGLSAFYDSMLDALFLEIGEPREALTEHMIDNIMMRIAPETLEIVGFEILDFLDDFVPENRLFRDLIGDWGLSRSADSKHTLVEPKYASIRAVVESLIGQLTQRPTGSTA